MIKLEYITVSGWQAAIRGMRNPMNSWDKSDSGWGRPKGMHINSAYRTQQVFEIGDNDLKLMKKLCKAGTDHRKFMRMINVTMDITAPQYWVAELDTYKIGTVRNSCSLQHKGATRPYTIRDFTVPPEIYDILDPIKENRNHELVYTTSLNENEYKIYNVGDREYRVYTDGHIIANAYECVLDNGNTRHYPERQIKPSQTANGYYEVNLGGRRFTKKMLLHRVVAETWLKDDYTNGKEVNHIDGNKGHNSVDNLEWVTHQENEIHKHLNGLSGRTIHTDYIAWKNGTKFDYKERSNMIFDYQQGMTQKQIAIKYNASQPQVSAIINNKYCENHDMFCLAKMWEDLISQINTLREQYLLTGDYNYFRAMRQVLPMGYNYRFTWSANYEVLRNIYHSRKAHQLSEWRDFCKEIEKLPYSELITGGEENE